MLVREGGRLVEPLGATTMPQSVQAKAPAGPIAEPRLAGRDRARAWTWICDLELDADDQQRHHARRAGGDAAASPTGAAIADDTPFSIDLPGAAKPSRAAPTTDRRAGLRPRRADAGRRQGRRAVAAGTAVPDDDFAASLPSFELDDDDADPLARKLELAEEFRQIGDMEGARDLLEEVLAKADGALKSQGAGHARQPALTPCDRLEGPAGPSCGRGPHAPCRPAMQRLALGLSYRGSAYHGWQIAARWPHRAGPARGGAGELRRRAGAHRLRRPHRRRRARAEPGGAHRRAGRSASPSPGCAAPTATCRPDIAVQWCQPVAADFHARNSARRPALPLPAAASRRCARRWSTALCGWSLPAAGRRGDARRRGAADRRARLQRLPRRRMPGRCRR